MHLPSRFCVIGLVLLLFLANVANAASPDPSSADYSGRKGVTIYVSPLGDDSDGSSWAKAFRTIQRGLSAVPDEGGGHRVIVRPGTYVEANLAPARKGARGAYNVLVGDGDGKLGSGASGWVIIDSGDPVKGFKSWDWWTTFAASDKNWPVGNNSKTFSAAVCDRWIFCNLYVTGSDAGLFWDMTDKSGEGFTVVVEDCVGIGRAFGGGVCYPSVREDEPAVFRRCYFLALDWVGDSAAVLVGGWEKTMPGKPHVVLEDCTMVSPDNALGMSYASKCVRVRLKDCRLIALNFTQPAFAEATGIITGKPNDVGAKMRVELEDCELAGYAVLPPRAEDAKTVELRTKGKVRAYVQFEQGETKGVERVGRWPVELFERMGIPKSPGER